MEQAGKYHIIAAPDFLESNDAGLGPFRVALDVGFIDPPCPYGERLSMSGRKISLPNPPTPNAGFSYLILINIEL